VRIYLCKEYFALYIDTIKELHLSLLGEYLWNGNISDPKTTHIIYQLKGIVCGIPYHTNSPAGNTSNTKDRVWPHFQTPGKGLKIRSAAEYFRRTSRCLEMWSNTVLSVWCICSIETKTKEKMEKYNLKTLC